MAIQDHISNRHPGAEVEQAPVQVDANGRAPVRIKVIGVGGGGCNSVKRMLHHTLPGVTFALVDSDIKTLEIDDETVDVIQIGEKETRGWAAGTGFTPGAAEEFSSQLRGILSDAELVFVTAGMGGGFGTGAVPYVAGLAKEMGALVVGVVTTPFSFEGRRRLGHAAAGVDRLRTQVDNLIMIHNDRLLTYVNHDAPMLEAFRTADEVVSQGTMGLSELINGSQEINVDFADFRSIMNNSGGVLMAIGKGYGHSGPVEAARQAIANPLLNLSIDDAKGLLLIVKGGSRVLTRDAVSTAASLIADTVRSDATIVFGLSINESMGEEVRLTLIATGLDHKSLKPALEPATNEKLPNGKPGFGASLRNIFKPRRITIRR